MKKLVALLLAVTMCLSCAACGKISVEEAVIGDWTGEFVYASTTMHANGDSDMCIEAGHTVTTTLHIFKGGTTQFTLLSNETGFETSFNGTWEVSDGILVITYSTWAANQVVSFEPNEEVTALRIQGSNVYFPDTITKKS